MKKPTVPELAVGLEFYTALGTEIVRMRVTSIRGAQFGVDARNVWGLHKPTVGHCAVVTWRQKWIAREYCATAEEVVQAAERQRAKHERRPPLRVGTVVYRIHNGRVFRTEVASIERIGTKVAHFTFRTWNRRTRAWDATTHDRREWAKGWRDRWIHKTVSLATAELNRVSAEILQSPLPPTRAPGGE